MIDVTAQIDAVRREVGSRRLEAGEARTVRIGQTYPAEIEDVWDACTNPERIPRWFAPVSGDLRLGGRYQIEGNAGGVIERCDPPTGFDATWEYGGEVSWITVRLAREGERTRFTLEHIANVEDQRWAEFGPGAVGVGWDLTLVGLGTHLATREAFDPEKGMAWTMSDEGRQFVTLASERWSAAHAAAGADPSAAEAAASRTTAFYTAVPEDAPAS